MNKKGFTLMEILAVIAILAIIAIIVTPLMVKTLNNAREKAFLEDAIVLKKAADTYYAERDLSKENLIPLLVTYNNSIATYCKNKPKLEYSGTSPYSGNIYISNDGTVEMRIYSQKTGKCAVKTKEDQNPHLEDINIGECVLTGKTC